MIMLEYCLIPSYLQMLIILVLIKITCSGDFNKYKEVF